MTTKPLSNKRLVNRPISTNLNQETSSHSGILRISNCQSSDTSKGHREDVAATVRRISSTLVITSRRWSELFDPTSSEMKLGDEDFAPVSEDRRLPIHHVKVFFGSSTNPNTNLFQFHFSCSMPCSKLHPFKVQILWMISSRKPSISSPAV